VFVQSVLDADGAEARFRALVGKAMRAECENDALKQIEQAEQALVEARDDDRIARAQADRAFA
jgi:hypothetical protein